MSDWQPIHTAPKDRWVELCGGEADYRYDPDFEQPPVVVAKWWTFDGAHTGWRFASYDCGHYGIYEGPKFWRELRSLPLSTPVPDSVNAH